MAGNIVEIIVRVNAGQAPATLNAITKGLQQINAQTRVTSTGMTALTGAVSGADLHFSRLGQTLLAVYAAQRLFSGAIGLTAGILKSTFGTIEEFRLGVVGIAASLTSFAEQKTPEAFAQSMRYASAAMERLQLIAAKFLATGEDLQRVMFTFATRGVVPITDRDFDALGRITDAIITITAGQAKEVQLRQEARALVDGQVRANNVLAGIIQAQVGNLAAWVKKHKEAGDLLPAIAERLKGFELAQKEIQRLATTWKDTIETIVKIVERRAFTDAYDKIVLSLTNISNAFLDQSGRLTGLGEMVVGILKPAFDKVGDSALRFADALTNPDTVRALSNVIAGFISLGELILNLTSSMATFFGMLGRQLRAIEVQLLGMARFEGPAWLRFVSGGTLGGPIPTGFEGPRRDRISGLIAGEQRVPRPPKAAAGPRDEEGAKRDKELAFWNKRLSIELHIASLEEDRKIRLDKEIAAIEQYVQSLERAAKTEERREALRRARADLEAKQRALALIFTKTEVQTAMDLRIQQEHGNEAARESARITEQLLVDLKQLNDEERRRIENENTLALLLAQEGRQEKELDEMFKLRAILAKNFTDSLNDQSAALQRRLSLIDNTKMRLLEEKAGIEGMLAALDEEIKKLEALSIIYPDQIERLKELKRQYEELGGRLAGVSKSLDDIARRADFGRSWERVVADMKDRTIDWQKSIEQTLAGLESSFATLFSDILTGAKSFGEALESFFDSIVNNIINMLAKIVAQQIFTDIFKGTLFGGGGAAGAVGGLGLFQHGGIVNRPTLAMLGEGGEKEAVIPEHLWPAMMGGGGGGGVVNIYAWDTTTGMSKLYEQRDFIAGLMGGARRANHPAMRRT